MNWGLEDPPKRPKQIINQHSMLLQKNLIFMLDNLRESKNGHQCVWKRSPKFIVVGLIKKSIKPFVLSVLTPS
jgi:hypothetical protein